MGKHKYRFNELMLTALLDTGLELQDNKEHYLFELDPDMTEEQIHKAYGKAFENRIKRKLQLEAISERGSRGLHS